LQSTYDSFALNDFASSRRFMECIESLIRRFRKIRKYSRSVRLSGYLLQLVETGRAWDIWSKELKTFVELNANVGIIKMDPGEVQQVLDLFGSG